MAYSCERDGESIYECDRCKKEQKGCLTEIEINYDYTELCEECNAEFEKIKKEFGFI